MTASSVLLGVNIDHVAFIKKSRETSYPDLIQAVKLCEKSGADSITIHLREDRRHIQDGDAITIRQYCKKLNFEMANTDEMIAFALKLKPNFCCFVPENRDEKTTEGGLALNEMTMMQEKLFKKNIEKLQDAGIEVSLFIDPNLESVKKSKELRATSVELHTGPYAISYELNNYQSEFRKLVDAANLANDLSLKVNAGHGLNYKNLQQILKLPYLNELNIGHAIIAESVFIGLDDAIKKIKRIIDNSD